MEYFGVKGACNIYRNAWDIFWASQACLDECNLTLNVPVMPKMLPW